MQTHDPLSAALEIREQLAPEKRRLGFFFGAGTSMAAGLPGIDDLTKQVCDKLDTPHKKQFSTVQSELGDKANVEMVLDRIRLYRELIGESDEAKYADIKGKTAICELDAAVCRSICDIVSVKTPKEPKSHLVFAQWIRTLHCNREWPVEIFTTNYDLLLEGAMEQSRVPFFDGFIGSVAPFFLPESVESDLKEKRENLSSYPPQAWTRLWKLHGSINWHLKNKSSTDEARITRLSGSSAQEGEELMIFPSRDKYSQSRKLPFIAFHDRLRKFVGSGETLVFVLGYSFSDEHINDILIQGLRSNPRLAISAFTYEQLSDKLIEYGKEYRNLSFYGPDKTCVGGIPAPWGEPSRKRKEGENWPFWDEQNKKYKLGDFNAFASYLEISIGFGKPFIGAQENKSSLPVVDENSKESLQT